MKNKFEAKSYQELLTEEDPVKYARIPKVSNAQDYHNVAEHLERVRDLSRIHICNKALYPLKAVRDWSKKETKSGY